MKFLSSLHTKNLAGKTCILRAGFDIKSRKESFRLTESLPTIKFLLKNKAKILIIAHRMRPTKPNPAESLRIVLPFLKKNLQKNIVFFSRFDFEKIRKVMANAGSDSLFLLENLRFLPGEKNNDPALGKQLASLGEIYINDAFSNSHRGHASMVQIPKHLPSFAGLSLEKEIKELDKILKSAKKPFVVIIGGAKVPEKLGVIKNLMSKADWFLVGGVTANTILKAKGFDISKSAYDPEMMNMARQFSTNEKIILPFDFIFENEKILDIGPLSARLFSEKIKTAKTILWNGPMGLFENKKFLNGSRLIAQAVGKSKAFSLVGGGDTTELIQKLGLTKKISFMSTGGGAMLEYLGGRKLPGLEALR